MPLHEHLLRDLNEWRMWALGTLHHQARQLERLEMRVRELERREQTPALPWDKLAIGLLIALAGLVGNLSAQQIADLVLALVKH